MKVTIPTHLASTAVEAAPRLNKLKESAREVEALFLKDLMSSMRKAMGVRLGGGLGASQYEDLFDRAVANQLSRSTDLGVAKTLVKSLGRQIVGESITKGRSNAAKVEVSA